MRLKVAIRPVRSSLRLAGAVTILAVLMPFSPQPAQAAPVTVNWLSTQSGVGGAVLVPIIKSFEQTHPGIKIVRQFLAFDQIFQQIQVRFASGSTSPDIIDVDAPVVAAYAVQGFLAPLDRYFSKSDLQQFLPATLQTSYYFGKLLAPPLNSSSQVLYYNKDLLSKAGIPFPPNDVTKRLTWEQVAAEAQKAQVKSGSQVTAWGLVIDQIDRPYQLLPLPESLGGQPISKDGLHVQGVINSPAWITAFTYYYNLFNTWQISPRSVTDVQTASLFSSGHAAFYWGGPWNAPTFTQAKGLHWAFAPTPYFAKGKPVTPNDSWHLGVNSHSAHPAEAAEFIKYITVGPGQDTWAAAVSQTPSLKRTAKSIATNPTYAKFPDNILRLTSYEAVHTAIPRPITPGFSEYQDILTQAFNNIRTGQMPKAALDTAASQIDRAMAKYRR
jgi:ABC-type glycerol-3-phosphate transport system substrate-binding protein